MKGNPKCDYIVWCFLSLILAGRNCWYFENYREYNNGEPTKLTVETWNRKIHKWTDTAMWTKPSLSLHEYHVCLYSLVLEFQFILVVSIVWNLWLQHAIRENFEMKCPLRKAVRLAPLGKLKYAFVERKTKMPCLRYPKFPIENCTRCPFLKILPQSCKWTLITQ